MTPLGAAGYRLGCSARSKLRWITFTQIVHSALPCGRKQKQTAPGPWSSAIGCVARTRWANQPELHSKLCDETPTAQRKPCVVHENPSCGSRSRCRYGGQCTTFPPTAPKVRQMGNLDSTFIPLGITRSVIGVQRVFRHPRAGLGRATGRRLGQHMAGISAAHRSTRACFENI